MYLKKYFTVFIILLAKFLYAQEVNFSCQSSKNKLAQGQRLRVEFIVNKEDTDNFKPPSFKNFEVISGPSQSISTSWINGKRSYSKTYIYILSPQKKGTLKITRASIFYKGKKIYSNSVQIQVVDASKLPKNPNDPEYLVDQNVHLVVSISKQNPYVGEGIYVEYRLYFSNQISISNFNFKEMPKYQGFWNQEIKINEIKPKTGNYNGESYRYAVLKKAILIPQKAGRLSIEPIKVDLVAGIPTGQVDFFGNVITRDIRKIFKTPKRNILVKNLPEKGKPEDFKGAVGKFDIQAINSKKTMKINESTQIKIQISGMGNLKLFELPKIIAPENLEIYTPEYKAKISPKITKKIAALQGNVFHQYTIVPQSFGKYKIPAIDFSYFDPSIQKYKTIRSEEIVLNVKGGKQIPTISEQENTAISRKKKITSKQNFRYIQTHAVFSKKNKFVFWNSRLFYGLLLLPFLGFLFIFLIQYWRGKKQSIHKKGEKISRKYLSKAKKYLHNKELFYVALEKALYAYLQYKLRLNTSQITREKVQHLLEKKQISDAIITDFIKVLDDCELARYAPVDSDAIQQEYEKAKEIITTLDKNFKK